MVKYYPMEWRVTYRSKSGGQEQLFLDAESRDAAFKDLAKRGISAIRIEQTTGKRRKPTGAVDRSLGAKLLPCLIVVGLIVVAAVVWYSFNTNQNESHPSRLHKHKKVELTDSLHSVKPLVHPSPALVVDEVSAKASLRGAQFDKLTEDQKLDLIEKKLAETPIPEESTNRTFRTGLEQVVGWVFTTEIGDAPPPLPNLSDYDLVHIDEILEIQNPVRDTDSDKAADSKQTVDFVKKELKKYLDKGGDPQEFLAFYHSELKQAYQEREQVQQQAMQILKEEPELVFDFLEKANARLAEKGIKAAAIPKRVLMRYGLSDE